MRTRLAKLTAVTLAATGIGLVAPTATALAYSTGGVSAGPLHWDPANPATRSYYVQTVPAGGTFSDQMRVQNPNPDSVDLFVNAVDGVTATPSGAVYANRTDPVTKAGAWVTTAVSSLTMPANSDALVAFTVHVPADAYAGDHLAGIAFENAHPSPGSGAVSIASVVRTVVGILITVPGPSSFSPSITSATIQPLSTASLSSVVMTLTNTGGRLGKPLITVALAGPDGYAKTVRHQFDTVLPHDTIPLPFPWPDSLAVGDYRISITVTAAEMTGSIHYADTYRLATRLTGVPASGGTRAAPGVGSAAAGASALPAWVPALAVGAALLLAAVLVLITMFVRLARRQRAGAARQTIGPG